MAMSVHKDPETGSSSIRLRVAEAKQPRDIGRGMARIGLSDMRAIGVGMGDVIEIQGRRRTGAKVWPAHSKDQRPGLIRIDSYIRRNCGTQINECVTVKKAKVSYATYIELAPVDVRISVNNNLVRFVKDRLIDRPVTRGDIVPILMFGHLIPFQVVDTKPSGIVKVREETEVSLHGIPFSEMYSARKNKKHLRFRCLKWAEAMYTADETWFYIPGREERSTDETTIEKIARKIAAEEKKTIEIRVELLEKRGSIEPEGFPWAEINPEGEIRYTYPKEWLDGALSNRLYTDAI